MPYFIGYKTTPQTRNLYLESFENIEKAKKKYDALKEIKYRKDIYTSPFFSDSVNEAFEEVKKLLPH